MKIKGITKQQLTEVINLGADNIIFNRHPGCEGKFLHFTLRVTDSKGPFAKQSATGRRSTSLCWHGHRDVMEAIFDLNPDALLVTAMARYEGRSSFNELFADTGMTNVGMGVSYQDCCECES